MRSDGLPLPEPFEIAVLHDFGLLRSDDLPNIAVRWLARGHPDTPSTVELAAHDAHDPWGLESLLKQVITEVGHQVPDAVQDHERILTEFVTLTWRVTGDTQWAVETLARLGEQMPDFDFGLFVGFSDEMAGGWGRLAPDLKEEARRELSRRLG